jgi:LysM repeat protein
LNLLLSLSLAHVSAAPNSVITTTPPPVNEVIYVVQQGETLYRIALRFGTTVQVLAQANGIANTALIYAGQRLRIPGATATTPVPTIVPTPAATETYTIQRGDTLFRIAIRFRTSVAQLTALNNIANPNIVYAGQVLKIPTGSGTLASVITPTGAPQPTSASGGAQPTADQGGGTTAGYGFDYGVEAFLVDQDLPKLISEIDSLDVSWVKQTIYWRDFEPVKGQIDFATLDNIVNGLSGANLKILFTVTAAPSWARRYVLEDGPAENNADYLAFIGALAQRYAGKVQAYEIWDEPNRRAEWSCTETAEKPAFCPLSYISLLQAAYQTVKASDPNALIISAGLSPTGFNDGVNAIDDRTFLRQLYANGLAQVSDAIGAHPFGWANPPDSLCCAAPVGVETHYENPSFYFRATLSDYRQIMLDMQDSGTPIWVTKFGWGTSEDTQPPSESQVFLTYTSLGEQAIYVPRAFELGAEFGFVGPMFVDNLNGCQVANPDNCYYALIGPDGVPRPIFGAVRDLIAPSLTPDLPTPTSEATSLPLLPENTPETSSGG